jgi:hypothetical protein
MGIKFGEIDSGQIIENEYRISVLEMIIEKINRSEKISKEDLGEIRKKVVENLNKKYPNSGIKLS